MTLKRTTARSLWVAGSIVTVVAFWLQGWLNQLQFVPTPPRAVLAITNLVCKESTLTDTGGFRFVLTWLDNDFDGRVTGEIEQDFFQTNGIELVRSARIVKAHGAGDSWEPAMRERARAILDTWEADVAIVGTLNLDESVTLWFMPTVGNGTLERRVKYVRGGPPEATREEQRAFPEDFRDDMRAQLVATAFSAAAPMANTEARSQVLTDQLESVVAKIGTLLGSNTISEANRLASLHVAHGTALQSLGEREPGTARLEKAVRAYRAALKVPASCDGPSSCGSVWTQKDAPGDWAWTKNDIGNALARLGEREPGIARLEEAVRAYKAALKVWTRKDAPDAWAWTQANLGIALGILGQREPGTARLEKALCAYEAALEVRTHDAAPLLWAGVQANRGTVLRILGEREPDSTRLEDAVNAYEAALKVWTPEDVPIDWAGTQTNLGAALARLGEREFGTARLEDAVRAFKAALEVLTREDAPLLWAGTQTNLGAAFQLLGEREPGTARLEAALRAYEAALEVLLREDAPLDWARTQNNLGHALRILGAREPGTARLEDAVRAYKAALEVRTRVGAPLNWAHTQNNLGHALRILGAREPGTARLEAAARAYEAAIEVFSVHDPIAADRAKNILKLVETMIKDRLG